MPEDNSLRNSSLNYYFLFYFFFLSHSVQGIFSEVFPFPSILRNTNSFVQIIPKLFSGYFWEKWNLKFLFYWVFGLETLCVYARIHVKEYILINIATKILQTVYEELSISNMAACGFEFFRILCSFGYIYLCRKTWMITVMAERKRGNQKFCGKLTH